ncbi:MAG: glycosyltransferase, partial [Ferruginibacter sp.]
KFFPADKIFISVNPVRKSISGSLVSREDAIRFFGLDPYKKTILAIGGSLGARSINEALAAGITEFQKNDLQLIWQTGKPYAAKARELVPGKLNIWVNDFITQMEYAYAAADVVISRSGAMSIAELCVMKKAAVFVPFPFAAEDHQTVNAQKLVNKNAGILIKDNEAFVKLVPAVISLSADNDRQEKLERNISQLAINNADELIANGILMTLIDAPTEVKEGQVKSY